ncbi:DUF547 domain-containing protein [Winogradskyella sp.]|uniref:DUF547 domain-containing protein n=1 Tax=Winogradskyella sp. TaxID=1883156 RepID=UPI0025DCC885|nr:DUF547 domain-containing protein [Winogradskyella sp.]
MKKIVLIYTFILFSSCCGTKNVIETQPEPTKKVAIVTEVPELPQPSNESEVEKTIIPLPPKPPKQSSNYKELIHKRWNTILQKYVSNNGNVDYIGIKNDRIEFDIYIDYLSDTFPDGTWSKNEKLAYWINAYNALTIDLILRNYPTKSIKDIKDPWDQRLWKFGDKWYNLNDIEHKILRKMDEPRIHFAIVCASVSCPKLQNEAFTASNLEEQLTNATKEFLSDSSKNELSKNRIKLSKIFKWFKKDFEKNRSLIDFLNTYSEVLISNKAKKSFKDYNWDLNE